MAPTLEHVLMHETAMTLAGTHAAFMHFRG